MDARFTINIQGLNFEFLNGPLSCNMFLAFKHVIEMRAKRLGINCIIVKTIVHLNTVYLNINRFSTYWY